MPLHSEHSSGSINHAGAIVKKQSIGASTNPKVLLEAGNRRGITIFNHSISPLYIDFGPAISLNDFAVRISPGGYYETPFPTSSEVRGLWETGQGKALIREFI